MHIRDLAARYGDLAIGAFVAVLTATEVALWDSADVPKALPAAMVGGLALALRRRSPLPAFILVSAGMWTMRTFAPGIDNDSAGFVIALFVSLYSLGRHTRGLEMWLGAVGVFCYILVFLVGDPSSSVYDLGDVAFAAFFLGGPWAAGLAIRLRRERERVLANQNQQLALDQEERARRAVAAERARIARELHDVVSHAIAVTVLQARGGRKMIGVDEAAVRRSLDAIEHTNAQALGDMRRLLSLLRDTEDDGRADPQPSLARLGPLVEQLRDSGLPIEVSITGNDREVPPGVDLSAYRIIQEALTNVLKHAGPSATAQVSVTFGMDDLDILVSDNGVVGRNGDGRGHGLIGIRERVAVVGGQVEAGPGPEGGFVVHAHLPYAVEA